MSFGHPHPIVAYSSAPTVVNRWRCDTCSAQNAEGRYRCSAGCDFDYCGACFRKSDALSIVNCHAHPVKRDRSRTAWTCDSCNRNVGGNRYRCTQGCDYDVCQGCLHGNIVHVIGEMPNPVLPAVVALSPHLQLRSKAAPAAAPVVVAAAPVSAVPAAQQPTTAVAPPPHVSPTIVAAQPTGSARPGPVAEPEPLIEESVEYRYADEGSIDDSLLCVVCLQPVQGPIYHGGQCARVFCRSCVNKLPACPCCRVAFTAQPLEAASPFIVRQLNAIKVLCPTCQARISRGDWASHVDGCEAACALGCAARVAPRHRVMHELVCPNRPTPCKGAPLGCGWRGPPATAHLAGTAATVTATTTTTATTTADRSTEPAVAPLSEHPAVAHEAGCRYAGLVGLRERETEIWRERRRLELATVRELEAETAPTTARPVWCLVDGAWMRCWEAWVANQVGEHMVPVAPTPPGPIPNGNLISWIAGDGRYTAARPAARERDYICVRESVWSFLAAQYGGGPVIRRATKDLYGPEP